MNIPIHDPNTCDECKIRFADEKKKDKSMYDPLIYQAELDEEYLEIKSVLEKLEELTKKEKDKYYCECCDVRCFSEDFYANHMKGRKHKQKEEEMKKKQSTKPKPKQDNQTKPGHENSKTKQPEMTEKANQIMRTTMKQQLKKKKKQHHHWIHVLKRRK